eukprot:CAMPEP_0185455890 /NCGR_PEP_ID=MMETSP1365-20130426/76281_1 /TAXON_ID=38817 /ORGANISM="Gephyrocapsa oceanica, Strain RCC1303" /LENGTH=103 /DNA_ID=CAMNT_0028062301 /DNA_START=55 /DNA_END=363 /DNA_ORIENTATION=+
MSCDVSRLKGHAVTDAHARTRVERDQVDAKVDLPAAGAVPPQRGHRPGRRRVARARRLCDVRHAAAWAGAGDVELRPADLDAPPRVLGVRPATALEHEVRPTK